MYTAEIRSGGYVYVKDTNTGQETQIDVPNPGNPAVSAVVTGDDELTVTFQNGPPEQKYRISTGHRA